MSVEELWEAYQYMRADPKGRCPCNCSWDGTLWLLANTPDVEVWEHTSREYTTAENNDWIHFSAGWRHDGNNPYGRRDGTWVDRHVRR